MDSTPSDSYHALWNPAPTLPLEIVALITGYVQDGATLKAFRLASHRLEVLVRSKLFRRIVLTPYKPHLNAIKQLVSTNLARHVQVIEFDCGQPASLDQLCNDFQSEVSAITMANGSQARIWKQCVKQHRQIWELSSNQDRVEDVTDVIREIYTIVSSLPSLDTISIHENGFPLGDPVIPNFLRGLLTIKYPFRIDRPRKQLMSNANRFLNPWTACVLLSLWVHQKARPSAIKSVAIETFNGFGWWDRDESSAIIQALTSLGREVPLAPGQTLTDVGKIYIMLAESLNCPSVAFSYSPSFLCKDPVTLATNPWGPEARGPLEDLFYLGGYDRFSQVKRMEFIKACLFPRQFRWLIRTHPNLKSLLLADVCLHNNKIYSQNSDNTMGQSTRADEIQLHSSRPPRCWVGVLNELRVLQKRPPEIQFHGHFKSTGNQYWNADWYGKCIYCKHKFRLGEEMTKWMETQNPESATDAHAADPAPFTPLSLDYCPIGELILPHSQDMTPQDCETLWIKACLACRREYGNTEMVEEYAGLLFRPGSPAVEDVWFEQMM